MASDEHGPCEDELEELQDALTAARAEIGRKDAALTNAIDDLEYPMTYSDIVVLRTDLRAALAPAADAAGSD